jgi:glutamate-ammonia-ligase adenylyltransferase
MGKLGGNELNYSSDIDLVLLCDGDGQTEGERSLSSMEFFGRVANEFVRLLTETTELGQVYRVDLRLRPEGKRGPVVTSLDAAMRYYDFLGRTWERQAYVKARVVAGDVDLGDELLANLESWIYRQYLGLADIVGIKALKRRLERRGLRDGDDARNVKTGHGGLRDIEFVIQFLQLLNGGDLPELRTGNTLDAIDRLEAVGCLTHQERSLLEQNYAFLRKIEHRLQIMFDLQTHVLPEPAEELNKLALRLGYKSENGTPAREMFEREYIEKTRRNRQILDHLLHDAFGDDSDAEPEVDLVLDPDPPEEKIEKVLAPYGFRQPRDAFDHLVSLATERIRFLSTRRCRMFLASIAPRLLEEIAATADPDGALVNLDKVSDSLGGKGVLWELLSVNRPSLELYVKLCAACPYLAGILTSNPGMIDELTDSLLMEKLPTLEMLQQTLADLCRGAEDITPILHSFKDSQHLRVGVRDIVGKDDIQSNCATLSDIAETCLQQIARSEFEKLVEKFGRPTIGGGKRRGELCELVILAMGKLGGREPNYHSDLDIIFLYEAEGTTAATRRAERVDTTSNQHFFGELGQRIIKTTSRISTYGRLYEVDPRLRPTGRSGALAVPLAELNRYFASGTGQLWERQALCKARVIYGSPEATELTMRVVHRAAFGPKWSAASAAEIRHMRARLEETASPRNLKRGTGGTVDVDFLVQMLQLKHGGRNPQVRVPGTLAALAALCNAGYLAIEDYDHFAYGYRFQRSVEARIRLMAAAGRHELPTDRMELRKLAYLLDYPDTDQLVRESEHVFEENRRRFARIFEREMA